MFSLPSTASFAKFTSILLKESKTANSVMVSFCKFFRGLSEKIRSKQYIDTDGDSISLEKTEDFDEMIQFYKTHLANEGKPLRIFTKAVKNLEEVF